MGTPPGLILAVLLILCSFSQIHSVQGGRQRRGYVLNLGDVGSQVLLVAPNVDNSEKGSGDGGDRGNLVSEMIMRLCQFKGPPDDKKYEGDFGPVTVKGKRPPRRKPEYIFY